MYSFKLVLLVSIFYCNGNCFNIDTDFPIIYSDPSKPNNKSYFGYSVVLYEGKGKETPPWIQIGAPRGHDPNRYSGFTQPGLVYRCGINQPCDIFLVDMQFVGSPATAVDKWPKSYIPKKDNAWIGATMDIDPVHERLVLCAPRWINIQDKDYFDYFIEGACYWSDLVNNNTKPLLPLTDERETTKDNVYNYPMGQAGMSLHIPKTPAPQIVMGSPGVYNWRGTVISYTDTTDTTPNKPFQKYTVVDASTMKDVYSFAYFGYSISSGYFFKQSQLCFVAGAPRASQLKGQVLVFTFGHRKDIMVKQVRRGETVGEYFGAAIGVADINGDGLDDLIIGAPHFSVKSDEGRIYICYGNRKGVFLPADQSLHITGNYTGGQFGLAIQSLGDIDNDKCDEIAVGAPYEDEEHGVIYIYKGKKDSTTSNPILVQRIEGKRLFHNLRGFGISFSKPTDIDKNKMKDIAVGSFLSDNAVLLRMRPVVELQMTIKSHEKELDRKSTQFSIETCFKFTGMNLPKFLKITRKIILDSNLRRAYQKSFPNNSMEYEDEIRISNNEKCHNTSILLKTSSNNKNGWQPILISVSQELVEPTIRTTPLLVSPNNPNPNEDRFCKTCPVVNRFKSTKNPLTMEVPFALNCGKDNICHSDLEVSAKFKDIQNDQFIIGVRKTLSLEIIVTNKNESAYFTEVVVLLPNNVFLASKPAECDEKNINNKLVIVCFIDNPLEPGKSKSITLDLDMESINELPKGDLPFQINATTKSHDNTPANNRIVKNLILTRNASVKITGKMEKNYYFGSSPTSNATVVYEVQKSGVSPLNEFSLNVTLPVAYKKGNEEIPFLAIHRPLGLQNSQPFPCFWPEEYIKDAEVFDKEVVNYKHNNNTREKRATDDSVLNQTVSEAPKDKTKFLNCEMDDVVCKTVRCTIGPFNKMLKGASLQIKMVLNATELHNLVGHNIAVHITTIGAVKEIEGLLSDQIEVSSTFLKESEDEKLDSWIIIVAVASGILILLFITLGLVKAGFFERKQKAKLEELKQREVNL